jgi:hypothetical protein
MDILDLLIWLFRNKPQSYNAFLQIARMVLLSVSRKDRDGTEGLLHLPLMMADAERSAGKIRIIMGDTDLCPYDAGTWGS